MLSKKLYWLSAVTSLWLLTTPLQAGLSTDPLGLHDRVIILFSDNTTLRCDKEHALTACKILDEEHVSYTVENKDNVSYLVVDVD